LCKKQGTIIYPYDKRKGIPGIVFPSNLCCHMGIVQICRVGSRPSRHLKLDPQTRQTHSQARNHRGLTQVLLR
jgi:hypothetical protein